ncbi:MAG: dihydroorotase [Cyclobacteriaceae bacterium]
MNVLLRSVTIIDKNSPFHRQKADLLIRDGIIRQLTQPGNIADFEDETRVLEAEGLFVSIGWMDMQAHFTDPGEEHKENLHSGALAAAHGGFTEVALLPNTQPVVQTKNAVHYLLQPLSMPVKLHPIAAVTRDTQGEEMTEMIDLHHAGAVAFSDGLKPLWHTQVMLKALQYVQKIDKLLINRPEELHLTRYGDMHEGLQSTMLGLKGMPVLAETIAIERDLKLLEYVSEMSVGAPPRLHFSNVSAEASVQLIRQAKQRGLAVSCDVAAHQLYFTDEALADFDTNFRLNPPLRTEADRLALLVGIEDGTIDVVVSSHQPQDEENKKCEFDLSAFGAIGLQTVFPVLNSLFTKDLPLDFLLEKITTVPRSLLRLPLPKIEEGAIANLTLFDSEERWVFNGSTNQSLSVNSPFWNKELKGRVKGTFYRDQYWTDLNS